MADIGTLTPEQMLQQQQILRQQKMAEMLVQQGMQQPQGQMVSGRYVAPSITQNLAGLANVYFGQKGIEKADQAQLDMAKAIREQGSVALADYMSQMQGRPATPDKVIEMAGPYTSKVPMPTGTIAGTPAVAGNPMVANMNALQNPNAPAFLKTQAMADLLKKPKWEKAEYTDERTGKTRQGVIDVNSPNPISTFQVGGVKPEMSAYERASLNMRGAELADQGIAGYGAPSGVMPQSTPMVRTGAPTGQPSGQPMVTPQGQPATKPVSEPYAPSSLPTYQYDPSLSPKQNREQAVEFKKQNDKLVQNARNSFDLLKATAETLATGKPSSGLFDNLLTTVGEAAGYGGDASKADAALKIFGEKLTAFVPRFEGPQSDKDTASYRIAAGDVGNPLKPIATRMAAVQTMIGLSKKYYPNGDWGSINTGISGSDSKVSLGPSGKATTPAGIDPAVWNAMTPQEKSLWK
jgi:hypothetical protein